MSGISRVEPHPVIPQSSPICSVFVPGSAGVDGDEGVDGAAAGEQPVIADTAKMTIKQMLTSIIDVFLFILS
jgi:hypothetical protein